MKVSSKWVRILFITGIGGLILGAVDPLEGSLLIAPASVVLAFAAWAGSDSQRKLFLWAAVLIIIGVAALFYLSSLGGFGGESDLSWWWGMFILPYPVGWFLAIGALVFRAFRKHPPQSQAA